MLRFLSLVCSLTALFAAEPKAEPAAAALSVRFPHETSDLPVDPAITWGTLPNGLRWAVMANQQPPGKVSMRLHVNIGSLAESDQERGCAHLLEHLAFNGTEHFPPGELNRRLQPLGIGFGSHSNAHTGFDETVYKIDLPDAKGETLDLGLQVLADYAGGMLLRQEEVDKEKGVVLAEMRDRDSPGLRIARAVLNVAFAGTNLSARFPIGVEETVLAANAELLRGFYERWYRPERMILVVVGDGAVEDFSSRIPAFFAGLQPSPEPSPTPTTAGLEPSPLVAVVHAEADTDATKVSYSMAAYAPRGVAMHHDLVSEMTAQLAHACLQSRLEALIAANPQGPLLQASTSTSRWIGMREASIDGRVRDGRIDEALAVLAEEWHRFATHGPTASELAVVIAGTRGGLDTAVTRSDQRSSRDLAAHIYTAVSEEEVVMNPAQARTAVLPILDSLTPELALAAFTATWEGGRHTISVVGPQVAMTVDALKERWQTLLAKPVSAPEAQIDTAFAYGETPAAGEIQRTTDVAHGIHQIVFKNGVVAAIQASKRKPGEVRVRFRFDCPPLQRGSAVAEFASRAFVAMGLKAHATDELSRILAGTSARINAAVTDDAIIFDGGSTPADVETLLQLLRAGTLEPGWRQDGAAPIKDRWLEEFVALPSSLDTQVWRTFATLSTGDTPGRRPAQREEVMACTVDEVRAWMEPLLQQAPLTVSVVGDIDVIAMQALLASYVGSLPPRPESRVILDSALLAEHPAPAIPRQRKDLVVPGPVARATLLMAWPTDDMHDIRLVRRLRLLGDAIRERLQERLREDLGQAYSPQVWSDASEVWDGYGYLGMQASVAPKDAVAAEAAIREVVAQLALTGIDAELLSQIQPPLMNALDGILAANGYWMGSVVDRCFQQPFRLDWASSITSDIAAITPEELSELAATYLVGEPCVVVGVCLGAGAATQGQTEPSR